MPKDKVKFIAYDTSLKALSRKNRLNPTQPEKRFWQQIISRKKTGYKFLRQKPIGDFIFDLYCPKLLLDIEIVGDTHYIDDQLLHDSNRTQAPEIMGN
ncbi:MAG: endonuclease [Candidatus Buchananbacteria bacterium CG10_big_fil_rev_8_21_14_0_10_42_9]|uniref:Endonuclease n=1 Tax=Candidatus Buchananbacteria bacterium CG10_big_fil_rev_8_21_14_0_10_42_9 TaxID=1974526 RepID=A0A2H0W282_9BACT|nr:MAG: endonuclease [Candidatus Buchananbacteria bacterium CG10_big_fil_rev_8_21_14_0_10_42_9]